jgi:Pseudomonas avirulence D protein (AvrD)
MSSIGTVVESAKRQYESIDDFLGPAAQRFFGNGHRRVSQLLGDVVVSGDRAGGHRVRGRASVSYPADWSVKSCSAELRPHLSTIDAALLSVELGECYLAHARGLDPQQRRRAWVRSVEMKASNTPGAELAGFGVEAEVTDSQPSPWSLCGHVSTLECRIGGIKVRCEIEHEPGTITDTAATFARSEDLLGDRAQRYYAEGYKRTQRSIADVRIDPSVGSVSALGTVAEPVDNPSGEGLGAEYRPALSPIDMIVTNGQLAQALLYCLDEVARSTSNTLWLRRMAMSFPTPYQPITNPFVANLSTIKSRVTNMRGDQWRTADLSTRILGVQGSFSVTHILPGTA